MCDSPIFLTGVYRSGTTLPSLILNNHSKLRITYDTVQFFRFYLDKFNPINKHYKDIIDQVAQRLNIRYSMKIPKSSILKKLESINNIGYKDIYSTIMIETFCESREDLIWGEKSVLEWSNIPTFLEMFPEGKTIHIIRDPRDVLASYREYTIEPKYRYLDAVFTCLHSMKWSASKGAALPADRYFVLSHENLVSEPEHTVKKLCSFLNIEYEPIMLDATKFNNRSNKKIWRVNTAFNDIPDQISPRSVNRWKTKLKNHELIFVESIIGQDLLKEFGYKPSDVNANVEDLQKIWKKVKETPLIINRLSNWLSTGEGIESYPSDPTDPANWQKD